MNATARVNVFRGDCVLISLGNGFFFFEATCFKINCTMCSHIRVQRAMWWQLGRRGVGGSNTFRLLCISHRNSHFNQLNQQPETEKKEEKRRE